MLQQFCLLVGCIPEILSSISIWFDMVFNFTETSLIHVLFESLLHNFQIFWNFPTIFQLLIPSLISFLSENIHYMLSILLNLLRCVLCPGIWSLLVNDCFVRA